MGIWLIGLLFTTGFLPDELQTGWRGVFRLAFWPVALGVYLQDELHRKLEEEPQSEP